MWCLTLFDGGGHAQFCRKVAETCVMRLRLNGRMRRTWERPLGYDEVERAYPLANAAPGLMNGNEFAAACRSRNRNNETTDGTNIAEL